MLESFVFSLIMISAEHFLQGDAPPKPVDFEVEKVDPEAGKGELQRLGLL